VRVGVHPLLAAIGSYFGTMMCLALDWLDTLSIMHVLNYYVVDVSFFFRDELYRPSDVSI